MYKLIAIDLDGTLLNSYGEISDENKKAIKMALDKNVEIVLTSGRIINSIKNFANEVSANKYLISGNGALIYDIQKEEVIYDKYMDKSKVLKVIEICEENSIYYSVYTDKSGIITKSLNYNILFYHNENMNKPDNKKININITQNIYEYVKKSEIDKFSKISICDKDKIIFSSIIKKLRNIKKVDVLDVAHMSRKIIRTGTLNVPVEYYYTEIINEHVNKWEAIKFLINKLNIRPEEVMTIGDNINDKEMLENAGLGVVMGNSAPYIKKMGNVVVADNNSNGVAEAITKYLK